ncbi:MAG: hypothetical protein M3065_12100, partial [Actinomycetota bacterium]|nr:hypothetical protein [Actinomycetota bacterium]
LGVAPLPWPTASVTASEVLIERYSLYLLERRGLTSSTVRNYVGVAREFLAWRENTIGELGLGTLDSAAVTEFVLAQAQRSCVGSAKCMVTRLRALLRFLHLEGEIEHPLADAVPSVASWRLASLVKALDARSLRQLLDTRILLPMLHDVTEVIVAAEPPRGSLHTNATPIVLVQLSERPDRTALKS